MEALFTPPTHSDQYPAPPRSLKSTAVNIKIFLTAFNAYISMIYQSQSLTYISLQPTKKKVYTPCFIHTLILHAHTYRYRL